MLNPELSHVPGQRALNFLKESPSIAKSIHYEEEKEVSRASTFIGPALDARHRCEVSSYYIHAVLTGRTAFLTTNLPDVNATHVTEVGTTWLLGRDVSCAITIDHRAISRCHAVVGHCPDRGFYIVDLGSTNGTRVNCRAIVPNEPRFLQDGDLLEFSNMRAEFFISGWKSGSGQLQETHFN